MFSLHPKRARFGLVFMMVFQVVPLPVSGKLMTPVGEMPASEAASSSSEDSSVELSREEVVSREASSQSTVERRPSRSLSMPSKLRLRLSPPIPNKREKHSPNSSSLSRSVSAEVCPARHSEVCHASQSHNEEITFPACHSEQTIPAPPANSVHDEQTTKLNDIFQPLFDSHLARSGFPKLGAELTEIFGPLLRNAKKDTDTNDSENNNLEKLESLSNTNLDKLESLSNKFEVIDRKMLAEARHICIRGMPAYQQRARSSARGSNSSSYCPAFNLEWGLVGTSAINLLADATPHDSAIENFDNVQRLLHFKILENQQKEVVQKMKKRLFLFYLDWLEVQSNNSEKSNSEKNENHSNCGNPVQKNPENKSKKLLSHCLNLIGRKSLDLRRSSLSLDSRYMSQSLESRSSLESHSSHSSLETHSGHSNPETRHSEPATTSSLVTRNSTKKNFNLRELLQEKQQSYRTKKQARKQNIFFEKNKHWLAFGMVIQIGKKWDNFASDLQVNLNKDHLSPCDTPPKWNNLTRYINFRELPLHSLIAFIHRTDLKRWEFTTHQLLLFPIWRKFICPMSMVCKEFREMFSLSSLSETRGVENQNAIWSEILAALRKFRILLKVAMQIKRALV